MKLIIGAEITPDDAPPVVLWPTDRAAYGRLARLITLGRRRAEKGECRLTLDDVAAMSEGLMAGVCGSGSERRGGKRNASYSRPPPLPLPRIFPDRCYLLAELHYRGDDQAAARSACGAGRRNGRAAGGRRRRLFPLARAAAAQRRAHGHAHGCTVANGGRAAASQRPAISSSARGNGRDLRRVIPRPWSERWKSPRGNFFARRTALRISRGACPAGPDADAISDPAWLGKAPASAIRRACRRRCAG